MKNKNEMIKKSAQKTTAQKTVELSKYIDQSKEDSNIYSIPLDMIEDNPHQPRKSFDEDKLQELTDSIKNQGVIQPIVVREEGNKIVLVAGERRLRASKNAGLEKIPAILTQGKALEISLIENLVREDLTPFEEADALQTMIDKYKYTQDKLAKVISKSTSSISTSLSLNSIPQEIKDKCADNHIPKRTLIEIARLETEEEMASAVDKVINFNFKAEDIRKGAKQKEKKKKEKTDASKVACKKVKTFKKYITGLEKKIDENYIDVLKEIKELQEKLAEILKKFE